GGGDGELVQAGGLWLSTVGQDVAGSDGVQTSTNNGASWCCRFLGAPGINRGGAMSFAQEDLVWSQRPFGTLRAVTSTKGFSWDLRFTETNTQASARSSAFGKGTFVVVGADASNASYILQSGNISGLPIIFQEPVDRSAVVDNPATFSVQAVGAPPLEYQWY